MAHREGEMWRREQKREKAKAKLGETTKRNHDGNFI
jgi:hypothetical protein